MFWAILAAYSIPEKASFYSAVGNAPFTPCYARVWSTLIK
jgi:hypothetical protein